MNDRNTNVQITDEALAFAKPMLGVVLPPEETPKEAAERLFFDCYPNWYDNGQLEWEVTYKGGKKDGYEKIYTKLGKLETEDFYQNGKRQIKD
jgi:hypothetical protein